MINAVSEIISQKTTDQYKIIEEKYLILKRYLKLHFIEHTYLMEEDILLILRALDGEQTLYNFNEEATEEIEEEEKRKE